MFVDLEGLFLHGPASWNFGWMQLSTFSCYFPDSAEPEPGIAA